MDAFLIVVVLVGAAGIAACVWLAFFGPKVAEERVAPADVELVRDADRAAWRKVRKRIYRNWKWQDDNYRVAAYRKAVGSGKSPEEAKALVRKEFPFYYLDPAHRDDDAFTGDDAGLPVLLRERVNRGAALLKSVMADSPDRFRTMNALIRECIRKGVF